MVKGIFVLSAPSAAVTIHLLCYFQALLPNVTQLLSLFANIAPKRINLCITDSHRTKFREVSILCPSNKRPGHRLFACSSSADSHLMTAN
ncbi:hypothetical protein F4678DRAFT_198281 [Xylaria arbuscula]|nr:hypothetical protein F4678DRAFT_198281 [Xylaria arbuscula]